MAYNLNELDPVLEALGTSPPAPTEASLPGLGQVRFGLSHCAPAPANGPQLFTVRTLSERISLNCPIAVDGTPQRRAITASLPRGPVLTRGSGTLSPPAPRGQADGPGHTARVTANEARLVLSSLPPLMPQGPAPPALRFFVGTVQGKGGIVLRPTRAHFAFDAMSAT